MPNYFFLKKKIINFMEFFEMSVFNFAKLTTLKICKFFLTIYRHSEVIGNPHLFPLHNEPSPILYVENCGRSRLLSAGKRHFSGERL